jgi:hypothetical protein
MHVNEPSGFIKREVFNQLSYCQLYEMLGFHGGDDIDDVFLGLGAVSFYHPVHTAPKSRKTSSLLSASQEGLRFMEFKFC